MGRLGAAAVGATLLLGGALALPASSRAADPIQPVLQTVFDAAWLPQVLRTDRPGRRPLVVVRNEVLDRTVFLTCEGEAVRFVSREEAEARALESFIVFTAIDVEPTHAVVEFRWPVDGLATRTLLRHNRRGWRVVAYQAVNDGPFAWRDGGGGRALLAGVARMPGVAHWSPRVSPATRGVGDAPRRPAGVPPDSRGLPDGPGAAPPAGHVRSSHRVHGRRRHRGSQRTVCRAGAGRHGSDLAAPLLQQPRGGGHRRSRGPPRVRGRTPRGLGPRA